MLHLSQNRKCVCVVPTQALPSGSCFQRTMLSHNFRFLYSDKKIPLFCNHPRSERPETHKGNTQCEKNIRLKHICEKNKDEDNWLKEVCSILLKWRAIRGRSWRMEKSNNLQKLSWYYFWGHTCFYERQGELLLLVEKTDSSWSYLYRLLILITENKVDLELFIFKWVIKNRCWKQVHP